MKPIQGRLKSFGVRTTQGEWTFDVSTITGAAAAKPVSGADAQPQPLAPPQQPDARDANLVKNNSEPPSRSVQQPHAESSCARDLPQCDYNDDDDAFMELPPRQPVTKKQCINTSVAVIATDKPAKNTAKYAHAATVRCAPSTLNTFVDHLTFEQRRQIQVMGFGGLLRVSAERLESRELLKFLFDRLDPQTMVISVTKEKKIHVTPFAVQQVLDLPNDGEVIDLHTPAQQSKAASEFRTLVGLAESQDLPASHLQKILKDDYELGSAMIDDDMAIRFYFIIACNKLLFPSTDNNIRCKDIYLTRDLSRLPGLNWCKAVVDDLRDAAVAWRVDKAKKSHSGCAIFLIILYLDNLQCKHQIAHTDTPRAKYFDQNVIKNIISADRIKDQQGKTTFGLLPLRNSNNTCYRTTKHPSVDVPPSTEPLVRTHFPSLQVELRELVAQIGSSSRKTQAVLALANFDAKAKKASGYMNMGQKMLQDAHQKVIRTLRQIFHDEVHGNNSEDHHEQTHGRHFFVRHFLFFHTIYYFMYAAQAGDVDMYERHSVQNIASESDVPILQPETTEIDMISGNSHDN
ncbi:unnamed protein product [Urochloa decumbens]|uniref:Uncharacterized protein n=1 Tax=Urochloa decumbens TaxID=240449 RepID=A0ABC8Z6W5_9POAL